MVGRVALIGALLVGAVAVFLMTGGSGEGQERCPSEFNVCIEYPEEGSGAVIVFTALDPEEDDVTWMIDPTSTDDDDFRIDEGRLTFAVTPDYEMPADANTDNEYLVTIYATDDSDDTETGRRVSRVLRITVTNVDEAGEVTLPTLQPQEGTLITATFSDEDGPTAGTTKWQWSRSTRATGGWTDIEDEDTTAKTIAYTPTEDDVGMYLRARVTYDDGEGDGKSAEAISANPVQANPSNDPPEFPDASTTRSVVENSEAGTAVGAPVTATDTGFDGRQETLTYALSGSDDDSDFDIDSGTGQIRVKTALDYEAPGGEEHSVTVQATDPSGAPATIAVTITVIDVDEAPTITAGRTSVDYSEDTEFGREVARYVADDPDGDEAPSLKWSLSGRDAARFAIGNRGGDRGSLTFWDAPDYEAPADSDRDNVYEVTVEVADRGGNKATRDVTVNVENAEEMGLLTVSSLHPQVGTRITPTLTDPDTPISNLIWTWEVDGNAESRANTYTPRPADEGGTLELSVTYTDGTGERRTLDIESFSSVAERGAGGNQSPRFLATTPTRLTILENQSEGTEVWEAGTAEDLDGDLLTYSMSGGDSAFAIDQDDGRITTRVELDREKRNNYRVTITVEDPSGARDTHSLTIAVDDENEAPTITSGDSYIYYAENSGGVVGTYRAADPEGRNIEWTLTGTDADAFNFDRGVLRFKAPPDYEDTEEYTVTVNAGDGSAGTIDSEEVTIEIVNVDEKGTVSLNPQPQQGMEVTATLVDLDNPDNDIASVDWQWARSSSRSGGFTDIPNTNQATYTPVEDDTGKYLRATATYTDGHGGGKSAHVVSTSRTLWEATGNPVFRDGESATREVEENARAGTNVGAPVAATDIRSTGTPERLTYSLSDTVTNSGHTDLFEIDTRTGQIKVKRGAELEFEVATVPDDRTYAVTVTASDPSSNMASIPVTITVTNVDEPPVLTLPTANIAGTSGGDLDSGFTHLELVVADDREDNIGRGHSRIETHLRGRRP